ncbi:predicted protein [Naegleria gruberi]|uniref:Predicted protein n=1 Tax=Naegleria gruberi TaxID=5762 RepID=D2V0U4_NAEGR|nr:uncharacterized protein NAEGRDRAFT_62418 [Naegleria gruberi]EFC49573.1 predicted protein [Naegleria gruberi]|eukprot:XP_002682317.1 predicted protein [Naegleria gruberi strain NEG-M]
MPILGIPPPRITRATQKYHVKFGFEIFSNLLHMMRTAHRFGEPQKTQIIKQIKQQVRLHKYEKNREKINDLIYDLRNAMSDLDFKLECKMGGSVPVPQNQNAMNISTLKKRVPKKTK